MAEKKESASKAEKDRNPRPDIFHPELPGAVGSWTSPLQWGRDMEIEAVRLIKDTDEKIRRKPEKLK